RYPAVGERMAVDVIIPARRQGHGRGGAEGRKNAVIADMEINRFTGMAIRQHDEEARRRLLQGFDGKRNLLSEDLIDEVRQVNDGFATKQIDLAHHLAGLSAPDAQAWFTHSR